MPRFWLLFLLTTFFLPACADSRSGSPARSEDDVPGAALDGRVPREVPGEDTLPPPEPGTLEEVRAGSEAPGVDSIAPEAGGDTLHADLTEEEEAPGPGGTPEGVVRPSFAHPKNVRGIYLNAWTAGSTRRREGLLQLAKRTEINTFVIDIKDASGFVSHRSRVPLAREVGATEEIRIRDLHALLSRLEEEGVYPIARIVLAKDPVLARGRPDLAIQDSAGGAWTDQKGKLWLNFYRREVWDYHVDLAREVARAGFPEIQWDYVRFPDAPDFLLGRAVFPGREGRTRVEAVREFLGYAREILDEEGVVMTADVFGVTTSYRRDVGIGQVWESFIDRVDVALPMVYPSHYWRGSFGYGKPNAYPYEIVRRALRDAVARSALVEGAGRTRPWLQDFSLGDPPYGAPEVRAQIQAAYDAGITEWILWNPGSSYTEEALIPARGLPSWLEPVMRVGGVVVPLSRRAEVLGEGEIPGSEGPASVTDSADAAPHGRLVRPGSTPRPLPPVPIPDTSGVARWGGG